MIGENVGCQDQISTAIGGLLNIKYFKNDFLIKRLKLENYNKNKFEKSIILFFTGIERFASKSLKSQLKDTAEGKNIGRLLEIKDQVQEAKKIFSKNINIKDLGKLLNENWKIKRELSKTVTNNKINEIYDIAINTGVYGGKLVGAGAGGFLMFVCDQKVKDKIKKNYINLRV